MIKSFKIKLPARSSIQAKRTTAPITTNRKEDKMKTLLTFTTVALAAALEADRCEIYSDVDGIYTADPRLVTGAQKLEIIDFDDMLKLAKGGSQVLHSRSVETAMRYNVPVYLLSSFRKAPGTLMTHIPGRNSLPAVTGITRDKALNRISVVGHGADLGLLAELGTLLMENGISLRNADCAEGTVTVDTSAEELLPALELIHRHCFG